MVSAFGKTARVAAMNKPESATFETAVLVLLTISRGARSRKKILHSLLLGPKNCNQLAKETGLDWWTVKKHLLTLMKENLIKSSPFGNSTFYRLSPLGEDAIKVFHSSNGKKCDKLQGNQS